MARDLQINDTTLGNGVKADEAERGVPDATGLLPLTAAERAESTKLRRENAKLKVQRETPNSRPLLRMVVASTKLTSANSARANRSARRCHWAGRTETVSGHTQAAV